MNRKVVQYLDVKFNLSAGTVSPHMKPNNVLKYVNKKSSRPASVIRYISRGVEYRISRKEIFEGKKKEYVAASKGEGHSTNLIFKPQLNQ